MGKTIHNEKGSAELINRMNKKAVLNLIRHEGAISRASIVKKTGLSAPTVTRIVESLIHNEGLAAEIGIGESNGGRPPLMVRFSGDHNYVIGLDWGRTHIHLVLADLNARIIEELDQPVSSAHDFGHDLKQVITLVRKTILKSGVPEIQILGMGVAAAGFVNHKTDDIEFSPNFGWSQVNLASKLGRNFPFPVKVENVSRVMALGELWYGLGKEIDHFLFVNIGYGIGAGIIINRMPMTGFDGFSGEVGHTRLLNENKHEIRQCVCGKVNCLECFASGRGIAETARKNPEIYRNEKLMNLCGHKLENLSTEILSKAANEGDAYSISVFNEAAVLLGHALANYSNLLNPRALIIGGKVAQAGTFFLDKIKMVFDNETLQKVNRPVELLPSSMPGQEAVKGAIALVLKEVLDLNL